MTAKRILKIKYLTHNTNAILRTHFEICVCVNKMFNYGSYSHTVLVE